MSPFTNSNNSFIQYLVLERAYSSPSFLHNWTKQNEDGVELDLKKTRSLGTFSHFPWNNLEISGKMVAAQKAHVNQMSIQVPCQSFVARLVIACLQGQHSACRDLPTFGSLVLFCPLHQNLLRNIGPVASRSLRGASGTYCNYSFQTYSVIQAKLP